MQHYLKGNAIVKITNEENKWKIKNNVPILVGSFRNKTLENQKKKKFRCTQQIASNNGDLLKKFKYIKLNAIL